MLVFLVFRIVDPGDGNPWQPTPGFEEVDLIPQILVDYIWPL
jgi:hypothetical protein